LKGSWFALIYFDNAATTPVDEAVLSAMMPYFQDDFGNPESVHAAADKPSAAIKKAEEQADAEDAPRGYYGQPE